MVSVPLFVTYNANGTYTWIAPPGVTSVTAVVWGAGGGAGAAAASPSGSNGGGGGAGECASDVVSVTPGSQYQVLVGLGGAGGAVGSDGTAGTDSSFTGDTLTVYAHGGKQGTAGVGGDGQPGSGGTGSVNSISADGGAGDDGTVSTNGGGGGGAGGTDGVSIGYPGFSASGSTAGGASLGAYKGGAGGAGAASAGPGSNGSGPGGGGGGALNTGSTQHGGGNGADGQVVITWTQSDPVTLTNASPGATVQFQAPLGATSVKAECWGAGAGGFDSQFSGGNAVAGSTTLQPGYGNGTRAQVAATFDGYVKRNLATAAQVVYIKEGMVQTGANTPQPVGQVNDLGAKVYVCINPSRLAYVQGGSFLTAEKANVATTCTTIQGISGISWVAILWNEPSLFGEKGVFGDGTQAKSTPTGFLPSTPNFPNSNVAVTNSQGVDLYVNIVGAGVTSVNIGPSGSLTQVGTAANVYKVPSTQQIKVTYTGSPSWAWWLTPWGAPGSISKTQAYQNHINYHQAYAPTVRSNAPGIKIAYKVFLTSPAAAIGMFPGGPPGGVDLVMPDWYALDFVKATNSVDMFGPTNIEGVADAAGLPLGLAEWGCTEGTVPPQTGPNSWASFITHFAAGLNNRIANNKPICDVIYFTGQTVGGGNNVTGPTDYKVPGIQQIADIVNSSGSGTPVGGAGGGGGEYAAESSLAITPSGLALYTITVGAGGTAVTGGGGNTTVVGDSVTVTGHGGSVATSTSAGGAGGSGSSNTTHHSGGAGATGSVIFGGGGSATGGGGGGGSGGTSSAGNAGSAGLGSTGGAGATAVTGGGPGGAGGNNSQDGSPPVTGPGGGGGARGAAGSNNGNGTDGQITLSNFITHPACIGGLALSPLGFTASGGGGGGAGYAMGPLALSATANVAGFTETQNGVLVTSTSGTIALTLPGNSTAGTLLIAQLVITSLVNTTGPAGWHMLSSQAVGASGVGHAETWMYNPSGDGVTGGNPGGISTASWTFSGTTARGHLAEYSCAPGFVGVSKFAGDASGASPVTSFPINTGSGTTGGDLAVAIYEDLFSVTTSGTWTVPAGWTANRSLSSGASNLWWSGYDAGMNAGTSTVTAQFSTSTSQTGWAAVLCTFTPVAAVTATGALALSPLGFAATGNAVVPGGNVFSAGGFSLGQMGFQSPSLATTFPQDPLPVVVEILINGTWTDISHYVYTRDGINITGRGRPDEASTAQPTQVTLTLNNNDGSFSPGNQGQFYPFLTRNTQIRISVVEAVTPLGAQYTGYRFWGQVPAWPPLWNVVGTDVYVPITACGVLQQLSQSKYSASPLTRYYNNQINGGIIAPGGLFTSAAPAGYWPCEDGGQSGSFASGIPGGSPMTWTGTPGLASDSDVPGSAPFAQLGGGGAAGSVWTGIPGAFTSGGVTWSTPGTYLWICPGGITSVKAECWGGGGGGGDGQLGTSGGGGEYAADSNVAVTPGNTYTIVVGAGGSGAAGTFTHSGVFGNNGKNSSFVGDSVTVRAHGGQGGTGSGGNGGTGSRNATHNDGGGGRNGPTSGNGGSGGGGSGGSASAGNNGNRASSNNGASGASAVTGGGPGGAGGHGGSTTAQAGFIPSPGPGGGGGGGGLNTNNNFGLAGGSGYAGQVQLTFGTSSIPPANVVRAIIDIPSGGGTDQANMLSFTTTGDVANAQLSYHTASGGSFQFAGHSSGGGTLFDSGVKSFSANGQPMLVSCELTATAGFAGPGGGGTVNWKLTAVTPGASAVVATFKGSFTGTLGLGSVTQVNVNNTVGHTDNGSTGVGHVAVQYAVDPILNLSQALNAHIGELAGSRFLRLCGEQNFPTAITGSPSDTPQMGPQPTGLLLALLQDCESADLGQMFELRDAFGIGYRTRVNMQNQAAGAVLDYSKGQVSPPLTPTDDELLIRNDIVATRASGSTTFGTSYEAIQTTGTLSVLDPPNGVGLYQYPVSVNLYKDIQLVGFATWLLTLGTVDEFRYPIITIDLRRAQNADGTFPAVAGLDVGDYLQIVNPPAWLPQMPINQLCFGFTETIGPMSWVIAVNAVPEDPYTGSNSSGGVLPTW